MYTIPVRCPREGKKIKADRSKRASERQRFPLLLFIVFCFGLLTFFKTKKIKSHDGTCCLEKSQLSEMSANTEAEVQMDLTLLGFVFVPHVRENALTCVESTLISDKFCAAGHPGQNSFLILSVDLFPQFFCCRSFSSSFLHYHMVEHLLDTEGNPLAPGLCS